MMAQKHASVPDSSTPQYLGLCIPLNLSDLLNTEGDWEKPHRMFDSDNEETDKKKYEENCTSPEESECKLSEKEKCHIEEKEEPVYDKDKWRESKRLQTLREESFASGGM